MISICIITKNEADNLRECLKRLVPYGFEIVVVDTGSTDDSLVVAKEYANAVYEYTWCDDFAKARNYAISKASREYILMIDTDEFITKLDKKALEKAIQRYPDSVGRLYRNNTFVREGVGFTSKEQVNRLFPKKLYKYVGRVHEQLEAIDGTIFDTYSIPVYAEHSGYDDTLAKRKEKAARNIALLSVMAQEKEDPYVLYQLGKAYYYDQQYEKAVDYFTAATEFDLNPRLEYVINMISIYGYAMVNANQAQNALLLESVYEEFKESADYLFMMGYVYMQNAMFKEAVMMFEEAVKAPACSMEGVNSYLAYYNAGVIMECLGETKEAFAYYDRCGEYELALEGIKRITV